MVIELIEDSIKNIISKKIGIDKKGILNSSSLKLLGADSLETIEIIIEIEEIFDININDKESEKIDNIQEIIDIVYKKFKKKKYNK
ncbi:phosphopantetheine-binding protein [Candidatus Annandia pinicola]|uniref:phosphopantetheine-binding protein n=1 Tax=Candidatus Annandia pinicola TaxID=1345117 RepID=UPI001D004772|nr:phosphopantetheine-binding protein [Candidatus Annandia pinicola]UDG80394.1 Acyl carrier protein [Candidatus Annandia pinicola]